MAAKSGATLQWGGLDVALKALQAKLTQLQELQAAVGEILVSSTKKRFRDGKDPDGTPWAPVDRRGKPLTDTGRLRDSIDYAVAGDMILVGSNLVYALIHQMGGEITPKKKKMLACKVGDKAVFAKKVTIKARPYLGISKEDLEEIYATIGDFIAGAFK